MNDPHNNNNGPSIKEKLIKSYERLKEYAKIKWLDFKKNRQIKKEQKETNLTEPTEIEKSPIETAPLISDNPESPSIGSKIVVFLAAIQIAFITKWTKLRARFSESKTNKQNEDLTPEERKKKMIFQFNVGYGVIKNLFLSFIILVLFGGALFAGVGLGYFAYLVSNEKPPTYEEMQSDISNLEQVSNMYFADSTPIGQLKTDLNRKVVPLHEISKDLQHAIVATEDEYFYKHHGVVPKAVARALIQEFTGSSMQTGGSTLTQQLVKQQLLTSEVSFKRKANEILLAYRLENYFTKDEILEAYLNVSSFGRNSSGQNIAGVEAAAIGIFGIHASELNLAQSAFIAGLPQSPSMYTPYNQFGELRQNLEAGTERKNTVLFRMYREKFITKKEYDEALAYDLVKDFVSPTEDVEDHNYSYVYNAVEKEARRIIMKQMYTADKLTDADIEANDNLYNVYYKRADFEIRQKGYEIHSTINKNVYDAMTETVQEYGDSLGQTYHATVYNEVTGENEEIQEPVQTGSVLMDNQTGKVISFVGGRDFDITQVDHAFDTQRQPGSTIKPLLVYAPALESGLITPATMIADTNFTFTQPNGEVWAPKNYGGTISGKFVSAREALKRSANVPTVQIYNELLKNSNPGDYLKKMGIQSINPSEYGNLSLSLGGTDTGPTVLEQTNAFATLANGGNYTKAYLIDSITDKKGNSIYQHETTSTPVFSPQTAYLTTDMMRSVVNEGTGSSIHNYLNFTADWAGKTGTSQNFRDIWFIASTPQVTLSSWIGYDNQYSSHELSQTDGYGDTSLRNIRYWSKLANAINRVDSTILGTEKSFNRPAGVTYSSVLAATGMKPSTFTAPNGSSITASGAMISELFNTKYLPSATNYHFTLGANSSELYKYWFETYVKTQEEDQKKKKEEEEKAEKEKIEKEKTDKEKAEKEKKQKENKEKEKETEEKEIEQTEDILEIKSTP
ncbi:transglycosylase domain-containing protein [Carnobacterium divergens]|uniref:transglycosylase domain-containing protein n=1 Tax=Carnobacterium divergens TaxID=2748 RepID=UPI00288DF148|nr:transglycosylase domain-containing protein [Carnobacterium divergens]MDT2011395.1 penicillin-binding protein [Carnobacterium divergens]